MERTGASTRNDTSLKQNKKHAQQSLEADQKQASAPHSYGSGASSQFAFAVRSKSQSNSVPDSGVEGEKVFSERDLLLGIGSKAEKPRAKHTRDSVSEQEEGGFSSSSNRSSSDEDVSEEGSPVPSCQMDSLEPHAESSCSSEQPAFTQDQIESMRHVLETPARKQGVAERGSLYTKRSSFFKQPASGSAQRSVTDNAKQLPDESLSSSQIPGGEESAFSPLLSWSRKLLGLLPDTHERTSLKKFIEGDNIWEKSVSDEERKECLAKTDLCCLKIADSTLVISLFDEASKPYVRDVLYFDRHIFFINLFQKGEGRKVWSAFLDMPESFLRLLGNMLVSAGDVVKARDKQLAFFVLLVATTTLQGGGSHLIEENFIKYLFPSECPPDGVWEEVGQFLRRFVAKEDDRVSLAILLSGQAECPTNFLDKFIESDKECISPSNKMGIPRDFGERWLKEFAQYGSEKDLARYLMHYKVKPEYLSVGSEEKSWVQLFSERDVPLLSCQGKAIDMLQIFMNRMGVKVESHFKNGGSLLVNAHKPGDGGLDPEGSIEVTLIGGSQKPQSKKYIFPEWEFVRIGPKKELATDGGAVDAVDCCTKWTFTGVEGEKEQVWLVFRGIGEKYLQMLRAELGIKVVLPVISVHEAWRDRELKCDITEDKPGYLKKFFHNDIATRGFVYSHPFSTIKSILNDLGCELLDDGEGIKEVFLFGQRHAVLLKELKNPDYKKEALKNPDYKKALKKKEPRIVDQIFLDSSFIEAVFVNYTDELFRRDRGLTEKLGKRASALSGALINLAECENKEKRESLLKKVKNGNKALKSFLESEKLKKLLGVYENKLLEICAMPIIAQKWLDGENLSGDPESRHRRWQATIQFFDEKNEEGYGDPRLSNVAKAIWIKSFRFEEYQKMKAQSPCPRKKGGLYAGGMRKVHE